MVRLYLVRYGVMGEVGRFAVDPDTAFDRTEIVVIRSHRGTELGEVLVEATGVDHAGDESVAGLARILRAAGPVDLERARQVEGERRLRFEACRGVLDDGVWPMELIDVEPLLDDRRTVLHYLGPHHLDSAGLLAVFRNACDLDVMFQPAGLDVAEDDEDAPHEADQDGHGCGSCGVEGNQCGSGGCGSGSADSCGDCGVKKLIASRR